MDYKTCFFIGSRYASGNIAEPLKTAIEQHITEYGVNTFIVGRYGNFDHTVIGVLRIVKKQYPNIKLYLLAPYALTQRTENPEGFDGTL